MEKQISMDDMGFEPSEMSPPTSPPNVQLMLGDCLERMREIPDGSVDLVAIDPPYGVTHNAWDTVIPFDALWKGLNRIAKPNAAILVFSQMPFVVDAVMSNRKAFRYEIIYQKTSPRGFLNASRMPLKYHENILVFYRKLPTYNPQFGEMIQRSKSSYKSPSENYNAYGRPWVTPPHLRYPGDIVKISNPVLGPNNGLHPTQKPVALLEYLIKTYSNPGDTVLDCAMGSGTTGVACMNTGRDFIGIEIEPKYFEIAKKRIEEAPRWAGRR